MSAHELLVDALQGYAYENDEQITKLSIEEFRCQDGDGYLLFLRRRT